MLKNARRTTNKNSKKQRNIRRSVKEKEKRRNDLGAKDMHVVARKGSSKQILAV